MGRRYSLSGENMSLGTGYVMAALQPAAAGAAGSWIEIERVEVTQNATSTSAQARIALGSRTTATTLTVTSATPAPLTFGAPASGIAGGTAPTTAATCGVNSSADSGGTYVNTWPCNPNNQGGFLWIPIPEHKLIVPPGIIFVVRHLAAPGPRQAGRSWSSITRSSECGYIGLDMFRFTSSRCHSYRSPAGRRPLRPVRAP